MSFFWFRKKPIHIDFFVNIAAVAKGAKPRLAQHFIPDWWKQTPRTFETPGMMLPQATIKSCQGFIEHYRHGVIVPLWSDYAFEISPAGDDQVVVWQTISSDASAIEHPKQQWGLFDPESRLTHLKLINPWRAYCKEDIFWAFSAPLWNLSETIGKTVFLPGTVNFKHQADLHLNTLFAHGAQAQRLVLPAGTPAINLTPLSDRPVEVHTHLVDAQTLERLPNQLQPITARNNYRFVKAGSQAQPKKCPFGFGRVD